MTFVPVYICSSRFWFVKHLFSAFRMFYRTSLDRLLSKVGLICLFLQQSKDLETEGPTIDACILGPIIAIHDFHVHGDRQTQAYS